MEYLKYLKALIYIIVPIIVLNILITILYYFNITSSSANDFLKLMASAIAMISGGVFIGLRADKKGWLEGIKIGLETIIIFFIVSFLAFDKGFDLKSLIYYFILVGSAMLGSVVGINKRKR